jgi:hypothetical protein
MVEIVRPTQSLRVCLAQAVGRASGSVTDTVFDVSPGANVTVPDAAT